MIGYDTGSCCGHRVLDEEINRRVVNPVVHPVVSSLYFSTPFTCLEVLIYEIMKRMVV